MSLNILSLFIFIWLNHVRTALYHDNRDNEQIIQKAKGVWRMLGVLSALCNILEMS